MRKENQSPKPKKNWKGLCLQLFALVFAFISQ